MADAERVSGQDFPAAPAPRGTLGELLSGLGVLRPGGRMVQDIGRIETAPGRLDRALSPRLPRA